MASRFRPMKLSYSMSKKEIADISAAFVAIRKLMGAK